MTRPLALRLFSTFVFGVFIFSELTSFADCLENEKVKSQFIVRLKNSENVKSFLKKAAHQGAIVDTLFNPQSFHGANFFEGPLPKPSFIVSGSSSALVEDLQQMALWPEVLTVEDDCKGSSTRPLNLIKTQTSSAFTNPSFQGADPDLSKQWALAKIQAEDAWKITKGSQNIIVAVADSGIDTTHEDLKDNLWTNPGEIPGNGIDDDQNGCVDDVHGCDMYSKTGNTDPLGYSHGTHVAGIIGAVGGNSLGISGVSPRVRLMDAKTFPTTGPLGTDLKSLMLKAIYYAVDNGAKVINASWSTLGTAGAADNEAFQYAYDRGVSVVVCAGNEGQDTAGLFPSSIATAITVGATDNSDHLALFSNWGVKLDLLAPGGNEDSQNVSFDDIWSTIIMSKGKYGGLVGTSMAAPHVSGLIALILSLNPNLKPAEILKFLKDGSEKLHVQPAKSSSSFDYMRINAARTISLVAAKYHPAPTPAPSTCALGSNCAQDTNSNPSSGPQTAAMKGALKSGCGLVAEMAQVKASGKAQAHENQSSDSDAQASAFLLVFPLLIGIFLRFYVNEELSKSSSF